MAPATWPEPRFSTTLRELIARQYKRDDHGRFSSGFASKGAPRDLADSDDKIKHELAYHDEETGLTLSVGSISRKYGDPYVSMVVRDRAGAEVGSFAYQLHTRGADRGDAHFDAAHLASSQRGNGAGTRMQHHIEETLRAYGNEKITGFAMSNRSTGDIGGFTWARQGWDFDSPGARMDVQEQVKGALTRQFPPHVQAEIKRVVGMKDSTPADFAQIGFEPGASVWPGKTIMSQISYGMVKRLDT